MLQLKSKRFFSITIYWETPVVKMKACNPNVKIFLCLLLLAPVCRVEANNHETCQYQSDVSRSGILEESQFKDETEKCLCPCPAAGGEEDGGESSPTDTIALSPWWWQLASKLGAADILQSVVGDYRSMGWRDAVFAAMALANAFSALDYLRSVVFARSSRPKRKKACRIVPRK